MHVCIYHQSEITHHCFGGTGRIDVCTAQGGGLAVARLAPKNPPMVVKGTWMNANITNTEACEQTKKMHQGKIHESMAQQKRKRRKAEKHKLQHCVTVSSVATKRNSPIEAN